MIFCGQCGLQLTPGIATCPRCGAIVDNPNGDIDAFQANEHTVASQSLSQFSQAGPITPSTPPQPLVLRPGTPTSSYNPQDATSMMEASTYGTNMPAGQPMTTQFPGGGHYPTQTGHPSYSMPLGGGTYVPTGMSSPGMANQMGNPLQQNTNMNNGNPTLRVAGLMIAFFGVLLMFSAIILFIMQQTGAL
jgi:hypothetical protein